MAASEIRIRVPHPSSTLVNNVVGVLGLIGIAVAVGGLAGWLWALLAAGVFAVALCLVGSTYAPDEAAAEPADSGEGAGASARGPATARVPIAAVPAPVSGSV